MHGCVADIISGVCPPASWWCWGMCLEWLWECQFLKIFSWTWRFGSAPLSRSSVVICELPLDTEMCRGVHCCKITPSSGYLHLSTNRKQRKLTLVVGVAVLIKHVPCFIASKLWTMVRSLRRTALCRTLQPSPSVFEKSSGSNRIKCWKMKGGNERTAQWSKTVVAALFFKLISWRSLRKSTNPSNWCSSFFCVVEICEKAAQSQPKSEKKTILILLSIVFCCEVEFEFEKRS